MRSCLATLRLPDGVEPSDDASSTVRKMDAVERAERVIVTWSEAMPEAAGRDLFELARSPCFCCSVEEAAAKRSAIQKEILELNRQRNSYVAEQQKEEAEDSSVGAVVGEAVRAQAAAKGIRFQ